MTVHIIPLLFIFAQILIAVGEKFKSSEIWRLTDAELRMLGPMGRVADANRDSFGGDKGPKSMHTVKSQATTTGENFYSSALFTLVWVGVSKGMQ